MTVSIRFPLGKAWVTVEGESVKDAMKAISNYADVFSETVCGACQSTELLPSHKTAKGYDFYEMECLGCGARLSFGQTREGDRLFPKRQDQNGNEIGKEGWHHYQRQEQGSGGGGGGQSQGRSEEPW